MEDIDLDNDNICGVCYAEFLDIDDLKLHITQYHLNETSKRRFCKLCSRIFSDIASFALHIRNSHLTTMKTCKFCTRVFNDGSSLSKHEKKHKSTLFYPKISCSHCIRVFRNKKDLESHEYEKHRNSDEGLMLQHCFPELSSVININIRKFLDGMHENYIYRCVVCDFTSRSVEEYVNHLITDKCQSLSCNTCCTVYPWKSRMMHHCSIHKDFTIKEDEKCTKCDKYFHISKLKSHMKDCTSMKCIPCNVSFDSVDKFAQHVTTHSHKSPVQFENCKYCRRPFIGLSAMQKHIERSHKHNLHLYKYNCIYCDIVFKHPKLLFGHFFTKHRDINPYTCKICNIGFRIRKNFTLHIKLDHKSVGFVEFDSNFHVFFTDKKSEKPFQPKNPDVSEYLGKKRSKKSIDNNVKDNEEIKITNKKSHEKIDENNSEIASEDNSKNPIEINTDIIDLSDKNDESLNKEAVTATEEGNNDISVDDKTAEHLDDSNKTNESAIESKRDPIEITEAKTIEESSKCNADTVKTGSNQLSELQSTSDVCDDEENAVTIDDESNKASRHKDDEITSKNKDTTLNLVNVNSDFLIATDTEADQTEIEMNLKTRAQKRKLPTKSDRTIKKPKSTADPNSSDSDVPLSKIITKKPKRIRKIKRKKTKVVIDTRCRKKMKLICFKCNRNCYTYQNYHRHMSMHMKNGHKTCVKCFATFLTRQQLENHMKTEHSSSKLTETLKKLLDKRKSNDNTKADESPVAETVFSKTIQKVPFEEHNARTIITRVIDDKLSVKKFLETFKPDSETTGKKILISNNLSIRPVTSPRVEPLIKMNKFNPDVAPTDRPQLRMPVKFRDEERQEYKVSIKLVQCEYVAPTINFDNEVTVDDDINEHYEIYNEPVQNKTDSIPEVSHEVLLDDSESKIKLMKKTIVLKDVLSYNNVRIGHLAPQAPFYKIVKIHEVLEETKKAEPPKPINITLPNGTKLVSVNPLAHLLGDKTVADIPKANPYKNKPYSYKPKMQDFKEAIIKAMKVLDKPPRKRRSMKCVDAAKCMDAEKL